MKEASEDLTHKDHIAQAEAATYADAFVSVPHSVAQEANIEKAYGGCRKCYGKGYATYRETVGATHGPGKRENFAMKYCTCDRGKQLKEYVTRIAVEARRDELIRAAPHQVAHFFEISQYELNSLWYLAYVKYRDAELQAQLKEVSDERS